MTEEAATRTERLVRSVESEEKLKAERYSLIAN